MPRDALEDRLHGLLERRAQAGRLRHLRADIEPALQDDLEIDLSSNDYLSFSREPILRQSLLECLSQGPIYGPASSRLLDGNSKLHQKLETDLLQFFGRTGVQDSSALLFNSGFEANASIFSTIGGVEDVFLYDELIHASVRCV